MDDSELLRLYLADRTGPAFGSLVAKHVNLVYSAARRQTQGDHHRAQEITQMVFTRLAQKAASLVRHPALAAWLYRSTRLEAADLLRREARRRRHEDAFAQESAPEAAAEASGEWLALAAVLDDAMHALGGKDREAIVLRYFANQPFAEVGRQLSLTENAARMRVDRAVAKLRRLLARRGVTSGAGALAVMLANQAVAAAPPATMAIAAAIGATAGATTGAVGAIFTMTAKKIALGALSAAIAAATVAVVAQPRSARALAAHAADLNAAQADLAQAQKNLRALQLSLAQRRALAAAARGFPALYAQTQTLEREIDDLKSRVAAARQRGQRPIGQVYEPGALDVLPRATFQARPIYPPKLRAQLQSGQATVDFTVDEQGNVRNPKIADSTDPDFEQPAIDAVNQWTFSPGEKGGSAVGTHLQVPIVFSVGPDPGSAPALSMTGGDARAEPDGTTTLSGQVKIYVSTSPPNQPARVESPTTWFPGPHR